MPLEPVSDFVKFGFNPEKYKKIKSVNHMLYRNNIIQEKGCIISISRVKVVRIKDCYSFNVTFRFYKISKAKISKKAEIGSPLQAPLPSEKYFEVLPPFITNDC